MKVPSAKGNPELLQQIAQTFAAIPGIEDITVNPTTGSLVMRYDTDRHDEFHDHFQRHHGAHASNYHPPSTEIDDLVHKIESEAEFLAEHSQTAQTVVDLFRKADREVRNATGNNVDLKIVLAAGIIGVTMLEVGAAAATPVWVTLTLFALNHVIQMHTAHDEDGPVAAPVIVKS
jgi:cation transport ATPase